MTNREKSFDPCFHIGSSFEKYILTIESLKLTIQSGFIDDINAPMLRWLDARDEHGFPLAYYLMQREIKHDLKHALVHYNDKMPKNFSFELLNNEHVYHSNIKYGDLCAKNNHILFITGHDLNHDMSLLSIDPYLKKGYSVFSVDYRSYNPLIDTDSEKVKDFASLAKVANKAYELMHYTDLLIINAHGEINEYGEHVVILYENQEVKTSDYVAYLAQDKNNIKILLTSCYGQATLLDTIKLLPKNSEILTISEYRYDRVEKEILSINMDRSIEEQYIKNMMQKINLNVEIGIGLDDIAILMIKDVIDPPSPSYAKKYYNGDIITFSCVEKLEEIIDGKINIEFIYQIYPKFKSKYCMNEDFYCNAQLDQLLYEYLNEPESGYEDEVTNYREVNKKEIIGHRDTNSNFDKFLALGCFVGFEMLPTDEDAIS
jgi:hypothetical protein